MEQGREKAGSKPARDVEGQPRVGADEREKSGSVSRRGARRTSEKGAGVDEGGRDDVSPAEESPNTVWVHVADGGV